MTTNALKSALSQLRCLKEQIDMAYKVEGVIVSRYKWSIPCDPNDWSTYVSKLEDAVEAARRALPYLPDDAPKAMLTEMLSRIDFWAESKGGNDSE